MHQAAYDYDRVIVIVLSVIVSLFVCSELNGTSAPVAPIVPSKFEYRIQVHSKIKNYDVKELCCPVVVYNNFYSIVNLS